MGTTMANPRPRSKKSRGQSRPKGPSSCTDQQRARQESPRPLLVLAVLLTLVAICADWATLAFFLNRPPQGTRAHLDVLVPAVGAACTVFAVMTWHGWWKMRSKHKRMRPRSQNAGTNKEQQ